MKKWISDNSEPERVKLLGLDRRLDPRFLSEFAPPSGPTTFSGSLSRICKIQHESDPLQSLLIYKEKGIS